MRILAASIAAVLIQPVVFMARLSPAYFESPQGFSGLGFILMYVLAVATAAVVILGIPAFLLLMKCQRANWRSVAATGFALAMLPSVVLSWPRRLTGYSSGVNWHGKYVDIYINGEPTKYAWLTFGESTLYFGIHGLVGALAFYMVWRQVDRIKKNSADSSREGVGV